MIEQERVIKQKQIDAIENGIKSGGVTRVGGKKVKFTDATTANMIGIQTALVTAQKRQEASKRKAGIKENLQRIKRGRKVAETTESAEASTAATREKIKQYREIAATGTDKERKRAEREAIKAFEELRKKQDERSRALIASAQAKLERAKKAGDAEAQKAAEGIIARQTALIEKRAQASKSQSYLTSVKTHKPKSTSVKEETKKRAKATGERSRTSAASAAEKGMGARHGSIEQAFKGEVEGLIKKHLTSDEIKKALGSSKKTVRLSAQEVRELAEVVKGKLEEKITGISGGRSTRSLEASEKELLKKLRAELKKIQAAEKRRADMMAKFGIKKKTTGQTTGSSGSGGSGDGGGSKPGFKKNDDAWRG